MNTAGDSTSDSQSQASIVEVLVERPIAQVAAFCGRFAETWLRGLLDPWGLGVAVTQKSQRLPAPFSFLVLALFITGLSIRLCRALAIAPNAIDSTFRDDLQIALSEVSLLRVIAVTLPCVLIVVAGAKLLGRLSSWHAKLDQNHVVRAACYSVGWQSCVAAFVALVGIALSISGHDPRRYIMDELLSTLTGLTIIWGTLILTPAVYHAMAKPRWWSKLLGFGASAVLALVSFVGSILVLDQSMNFAEAGELSRRRQYAALEKELTASVGDLQADVLQWHKAPIGDDQRQQQRFELTIAFTNRVKTLLVVPRQSELLPSDDPRIQFQANRLRVVSSSLDTLVDRALLVEPGQTRIAEFVLEAIPEHQPPDGSAEKQVFAPYQLQYHRRGLEGAFYQDHTLLLPPPEIATDLVW